MQLHIKNMVCNRCITTVKSTLETLGFITNSIALGEAIVEEEIPSDGLAKINQALLIHGFELIQDKKSTIIEKIKNLIIELIHYTSQTLKTNYSDFIAENVGLDYEYLSHIFSETEQITIEKYIILQKTERIKELLSYNELSISEIAFQMNYSSVQHLSNQFKKITGLTPTDFREKKSQERKTLDSVG
ncbi:MAG: helix-turn-helix domain-containing protein [Verrucomicrobia bacterium]|nr:helix-turn-helix domain-containing protein [Cytophagales bacterium]